MPWSIVTNDMAKVDTDRVLADLNLPNTVTDNRAEYARQLDSAKRAAAQLIGQVGDPDSILRVEISSHANPDNFPHNANEHEFITVTVREVGRNGANYGVNNQEYSFGAPPTGEE